jgi:predicted Zn-dependent protease
LSTPTESTGTIDVAIAHARRLLEKDPGLAVEQALEILQAAPNHPPAVLILAEARRRQGQPAVALEVLGPLLQAQPNWAAAHFEHALALARLGRGGDAVAALQRTVALKPDHPVAWRHLADHLLAMGNTDAGDAAYARHIQASARQPALQQAAAAMLKNELAVAERLLKTHLKQAPTDVPAIRMLAEVAVRCGRYEDAGKLLQRCLELAPGFAAARYN